MKGLGLLVLYLSTLCIYHPHLVEARAKTLHQMPRKQLPLKRQHTAPPTTAPPTTAPPTTAPQTTPASTAIPYYTGCGGHLVSSRGIMSSPNYPEAYNNNCDCFWHIQVPPGNTISINFNFMSIEYHRLCIYDALIIRDGGSMSSPVLGGRMCGAHSVNFPHLTTTGNEAYIHFRSDYINTLQGFELQWKTVLSEECPTYEPCPAVKCPPCLTCPPKLTCPTVSCPEGRSIQNLSRPLQRNYKSFSRIVRNCGRSFSNESGNFSSPGWPEHYSNNLDCFWTITTAVGKKINLVFTDMEVEYQRLCRYDAIIFRDGNSPTSPMIGQKVCGALHPQKGLKISSTGNEIFIHFRSDYTEYKKGFSLEWTSESLNDCPPPPTCPPEISCECETCPPQSTCPPPVTCPPTVATSTAVPAGFESFGGRVIRRTTTSDTRGNYTSGISFCKGLGAEPFVPRISTDYDLYRDVRTALGVYFGWMWIPADDRQEEGTLRWYNGSLASNTSFFDWVNNQTMAGNEASFDCVLLGYCGPPCAYMYTCTYSAYPPICEII